MPHSPIADATPAPIVLGFGRGMAPSKWAERFARAFPAHPFELRPLDVAYGRADAALSEGTQPVDVMLERTLPGEKPVGAETGARSAIRLYVEAPALVVPKDHELASADSVDVETLALVSLIDHPWHSATWPSATPWADDSYTPRSFTEALSLVGAGLGGLIAPRTLARHLGNKREQAILTISGDPALAGTTVWATWNSENDRAGLQDLIGILRGRTARSSRSSAASSESSPSSPGAAKRAAQQASKQTSKQTPQQAQKRPKLNPNSRGAQLAAAKERSQRAKRGRGRG